MATQTSLEKMSGAVDSMTQPVFVYDDGDPPVAITEAAALAAAQAAAPATIFSVAQDPNPGVEQISYFAYRITITYRARSLRRLSNQGLGEIRYNMNLVAKPRKDVRFAPEVNKFPASAPTMKGLLTMTRSGNSVQPMGITVQPPPPNSDASTVVARTTLTDLYLRTLPTLIGKYNSSPLGIYAVGEVFMSRIILRLLDDNNVLILAGWSIEPNVTGETRGDVTGVSYKGHEYVWDMFRPVVDRNGGTLALIPQYTYVNDIWGSADLSQVGISPP